MHAHAPRVLQGGVKAYNLFAVQKLADDVAAVEAFAAGCPVPNLAQEFAEPSQLCTLLLAPTGLRGERGA